MSTPTVLITDLDNTVWDWFHAWYASFSSMLERLEMISGVPASTLEPEIRAVHQRRGTSECANTVWRCWSRRHYAFHLPDLGGTHRPLRDPDSSDDD